MLRLKIIIVFLLLTIMMRLSLVFADNLHLNNAINILKSINPVVFSVRVHVNWEPLNLVLSQLTHAVDEEESSNRDLFGGHCSDAKEIIDKAIISANIINEQVKQYNLLTGSVAIDEARNAVNILKTQVKQYNSLIKEAIAEVKMAISYWDEHHDD